MRIGETLNSTKDLGLGKNLNNKITDDLKSLDSGEAPYSKSTPIGEDFTSEKAKILPKEGNPVVYQEGNEIRAEEVLIKKYEDIDISLYGGGYVQKTAFIEGYSSIGVKFFDMTFLPLGSNNVIMLGVQLIVEGVFGVAPDYWRAYWYPNSIRGQKVIDNKLDVVGSSSNNFYDSNADSNVMFGNTHIRIELHDGVGALVGATSVGRMVGFMHYIEMPIMVLPG